MNKDIYNELLRLRRHEEHFIRIMCESAREEYRLSPRDVYDGYLHQYMSQKRFLYILQKFSDKGIYDYGVALDLGWFE